MNTRLFVLPTLCLGGAALLLAPARSSQAFSKIGGSLGEAQRDVRVFDNFLDATANDNTTPTGQFPGGLGVELAVWKAIVEWGSLLHGDGSGDPVSGNLLGDGGANFDALWAGNADSVGSVNSNIVSSQAVCGGGGTLAYTETPISDGWRIRFCDEWLWNDGPSTIGASFDIQGVMVHEYGHALGLGHSGNGQATMAPSVSQGSTTIRSIHADDIAGIQCIYGVASLTKPTITATVADPLAQTLTIHGTQFGGVGNEVWFTHAGQTASGVDPIVRLTNVPSTSGVLITVAIPPEAGPGDVMVNREGGGGATLSNAFPTDLVGTFGIPADTRPDITGLIPATIEGLVPGTEQTLTITGTNLDFTTDVLLDGVSLPAARYTLLDANTITLDLPQVATLGLHELGVSNGVTGDVFQITIVAPATPKLEFGTGDPLNVVDRELGLTFRVGGIPGRRQRVFASLSDRPSTSRAFSLDIGNAFTNLFFVGNYTIPPSGWLQVDIPPALLPDPGIAGTVFHCQSIELRLPRPFDASNPQSIRLVQ